MSSSSAVSRCDATDFETVIREHGGRMLLVARRLLRNEHDAQDAVQDAFLSAYKSSGSFQGNSQLATWLHRIVVNACLMKLRSERRRPALRLDELLPTFDDTGHHVREVRKWSDSPLQRVMDEEMRVHVRSCIDQLPELYRTVLILRDIEELDTEQTAQLLQVTESVVKTRLHRARQALRTLLELALATA